MRPSRHTMRIWWDGANPGENVRVDCGGRLARVCAMDAPLAWNVVRDFLSFIPVVFIREDEEDYTPVVFSGPERNDVEWVRSSRLWRDATSQATAHS